MSGGPPRGSVTGMGVALFMLMVVRVGRGVTSKRKGG